MNKEQDVSRRKFFNLTAAAGMGTVALGSIAASGPTQDKNKKYQAVPQIRLLADKIVEWQMDVGRLDPRRTRWANWSSKRNSYPRLVNGLNQACRVTGVEAYRSAADRMAVFYLGCLCNSRRFCSYQGCKID